VDTEADVLKRVGECGGGVVWSNEPRGYEDCAIYEVDGVGDHPVCMEDREEIGETGGEYSDILTNGKMGDRFSSDDGHVLADETVPFGEEQLDGRQL